MDGAEGRLAELSRIRARIVGDLYRSSYHRVFCFARRLVGEVEAEEVAHEAFVRLLRVRNLERMNISVAYLLRIAENLIRRKHGRAQRFREVLERSGRMVLGIEQAVAWPKSVAPSEVRIGSLCFDSECIEDVLHRLSPSEQSAVRLIVCEGLDYQAAASSLGVPVSTINNWKHRALGKLKQLFEDERLSKPRGRLSVG
jgi:RNA polymerase sigma-70 factor (ECF subfamily)